jgi:hypothetical protein
MIYLKGEPPLLKSQTLTRMVFSILVLTTFGLLSSAITVRSQQEAKPGAINTSRSNIKVARERQPAGEPLKGIWVRLAKHELTHVAQAGRVTATDGGGNFSFADVTPGEYVLTLHLTEEEAKQSEAADAGSGERLSAAIHAGDANRLNLKNVHVSVTGASSAPIEKDWDFAMKQASDAKTRPGQPSYGNITVRVDGASNVELKGIVSLLK